MGRGGPVNRAGRALAAAACVAASALAGCSTVDPYEITCRELVTSPDKLRETAFKLAKDDVQAKIRYQDEMARICADAPEDFRPAQRVKPEA